MCVVYIKMKKKKRFHSPLVIHYLCLFFPIRNIVEKTPSDGDLKLDGFTFTNVQSCVITCP